MKNKGDFQEKFLREPLPVRLGELAVSLAQIKSFSDHPAHSKITAHFIEESLCYVEWTVPDVEAHLRAELLEIHRQLSDWHTRWDNIWADDLQKQAAINQSKEWSDRMMEASGLLRPAREVA
jgi:hypothetical protein